MVVMKESTTADETRLPLMLRLTQPIETPVSPVEEVEADNATTASKYDPVTQVAYQSYEEIVASSGTTCDALCSSVGDFSFDEMAIDVKSDD